MCDSQAETVCCPRVLGSLVTPRGTEHTVYAVTSERLGLRTAAGDRESWEQAEVFFWTQENCFPGIGEKLKITRIVNNMADFQNTGIIMFWRILMRM